MGPSKVLTTFPLQNQSFWQLSLLELPPCCVPSCNIVTSSLGLLQHVYLLCRNWPPSANAALSPHPRLQTSYFPICPFCIFSLCPPFLAPGCPSTPPASFLPLTLSGFFNGMLGVFEPGALNYFTFFRPILLTLFLSRNPILTHLLLSGLLDSLLCVVMVPALGLAFSLVIPRTLAAASSFSSGRAYLSLNFLPLLFLRLISALIM